MLDNKKNYVCDAVLKDCKQNNEGISLHKNRCCTATKGLHKFTISHAQKLSARKRRKYFFLSDDECLPKCTTLQLLNLPRWWTTVRLCWLRGMQVQKVFQKLQTIQLDLLCYCKLLCLVWLWGAEHRGIIKRQCLIGAAWGTVMTNEHGSPGLATGCEIYSRC